MEKAFCKVASALWGVIRGIPGFFGADFQFHTGTVIYVESTIEEHTSISLLAL
jgi:hypothetical protein